MIATEARGAIISAVNEPARQAGVNVGQTLADARSRWPSLATAAAEPAADQQALRRLSAWASRYGPSRGLVSIDGLWIDVTGVAHLFGGEDGLAHDLLDRLTGFGLSASLGLADTLGAAYALARHAARPIAAGRRRPGSGQGCRAAMAIAAAGATAQALAPLPVEGLRLDVPVIVLLKRLGLRRIGDLYALPRQALEQRFRSPPAAAARSRRGGRARATANADVSAGAVLLRLDQALGRCREAVARLPEPAAHLVRRAFAEPQLSSAALEQTTLDLAQALCDRLGTAALGARRLRLRLYRCDGSVATVTAGTSAASREARHIAGLLTERLASVDAGFGIDMVTLEAVRTEAAPALQAGLDADLAQATRRSPTLLVDRLVNRLGEARVLRLRPRASHVPERAEARCPALLAPLLPAGAPDAGSEIWAGAPAERPPFLLAPPEPVSVMAEVPEGAPRHFTWRRRHHRVRRARGPERIEPEWWRELAPRPPAGDDREAGGAGAPAATAAPPDLALRASRARDYYVLEDEDGGRFWVFREGRYAPGGEDAVPRWYVHGLFC